MQSKIYSVVIISIFVFALIAIISTIAFEIVLAQEDGDTELGGEPELGGDTGMTESDIENDTEITNGQNDEGIGIGGG
jgi:hypothetical protein